MPDDASDKTPPESSTDRLGELLSIRIPGAGGQDVADASSGIVEEDLASSGVPSSEDLEEAQRILAEKGVTEETLLTDGAAFHQGAAEWQCRICKAYNSAVVDDAGVKRIVPEKSLFCWNCGHSAWNTVEGGHHDQKVLELVGPLQAGHYKPPPKEFLEAIRQADAALDECELFPETGLQEDKEPHWPHDVAVTILASALHLGNEMKSIGLAMLAEVERSQ